MKTGQDRCRAREMRSPTSTIGQETLAAIRTMMGEHVKGKVVINVADWGN